MTASGATAVQIVHSRYRNDRTRRTLRGIDEQMGKAEQAVVEKTPVKRNRFVQLSGGATSVNRELEGRPGAERLHHQSRRLLGHRRPGSS